MKQSSLLIVLLCVWAIRSESIDYKRAAEIFKKLRIDSHLYGNEYRQSPDPVSRFLTFMRDHARVYTSREDLFQKHENFKANVEMAEDFQSLDTGTATYSINKYSDWSAEDLNTLGGLKLDDEDLPEETGSIDNFFVEPFDFLKRLLRRRDVDAKGLYSSQHVPKRKDWREEGAVSKVKQQGRCSCCYAFSVIGVVEGMHAIKSGNLTELSAQQLVDCDNLDGGCDGGRMDNTLQYIQDDGGVVTEKKYPFIANENRHCLKDKLGATPKVQVTGYQRLSKKDEEGMKNWIALKGPLSVGLNALSLYYYTDGVMDLDAKSCNPYSQNHAVLLVGYGEETDKSGRKIPYWILKNSWGTDWGEEGYFRLRRGTNTCGVALFVHGATTN